MRRLTAANQRTNKRLLAVCVLFFFRPIGKTRRPSWPLICWGILDFYSETAKRNSTNLDRKQDFHVLYHVCVFRAWKIRWPTGPLLGWDIFYFSSETWKGARSQRPLPRFCVSDKLVNKNGRPGRSVKRCRICGTFDLLFHKGPSITWFHTYKYRWYSSDYKWYI